MGQHTVILCDDDPAIRKVLGQALQQAGYQVSLASTALDLKNKVSLGEGDLVVTDVSLPDGNALDIIPSLRETRADLPIIVMSARKSIMTAIRANEVGSYEYLPKPFDLDELIAHVDKAAELYDRKDDMSPVAEAAVDPTSPLVGNSQAMQAAFRVMARVMKSDLTVLICGETGTGKELVARTLHNYGPRRKEPFIAVNMAAIPSDLIESELFGHEKGAFTGAVEKSVGKFEQAQNGTLFLDEIGDMPLQAQTRLLRVLQEGEYMPVGGKRSKRADVRILAATHQDLRQLIKQGRFREDLYYRLNVVPLRLPPLRERAEDIPALCQKFLRDAATNGSAQKSLSTDAVEWFSAQPWPGNVRELENAVRRLVLLVPENPIGRSAVIDSLGQAGEESRDPVTNISPSESVVDNVSGERTQNGRLEHFAKTFVTNFLQQFPPEKDQDGDLYRQLLQQIERPMFEQLLRKAGGNQRLAAQWLGINRNTLRKKLRELGLLMHLEISESN